MIVVKLFTFANWHNTMNNMITRIFLFIFSVFISFQGFAQNDDARFYSRLLAGEALEITVAAQGCIEPWQESLTISCNEEGYFANWKMTDLSGKLLQPSKTIKLNPDQLEAINTFEKAARAAEEMKSLGLCSSHTTYIIQVKSRFIHFTDRDCTFTAYHQLKDKLVGGNI